MRTLEDRLRAELAHAEAEARYWREAYFEHMASEHPEAVAAVNARSAA
jgi:hypothetical protein